jgi:sigma-B regulation protein RsbU (phosphoserine phosphatase)
MPKRSLLYVVLCLLLVVSLTYHVRELVLIGESLFRDPVQYPFVITFGNIQSKGLQPEARSAGVQAGDSVLTVFGQPYRGPADLVLFLHKARPGGRLDVQVRSSAGRETNASILLKAPADPPTTRQIVLLLVGITVPLFCIALGGWVTAVRITDPIAWIFLGMMISFGETAGGNTIDGLFGHADLLQVLLTGYQQFSANVWSVFMMLFGIYFTERIGADRRWPLLKWLLAVPILIHALLESFVAGLTGTHIAAATRLAQFIVVGRWFTWLHIVAVCCFFASIGYKTFTAQNRDARRRLMLLYAGTTISITPAFIVIMMNLARGLPQIIGDSVLEKSVLFLMLIGFPLTLAYVIVIERAMDVRVVVRQGLQYLLASKGVFVLQAVLTAAIVIVAATRAEALNLPQRITLVGFGIGLVFLIQRSAQKMSTWIDRRFFREAYDAEQLLSELAEKVRTIVETGPLLETVARRISESLHIPRLAVLVSGGGTFRVAYALGYPGTPDIVIPAEIPDPETAAQKQLDAELVLPLSVNQKTLGLITLGPKRSEEPYSSADLRLLGSVATQTGLALENSRLTAEVAAEAAQRERLNREIEIAREVQERLFPQSPPEMPGLDYTGSCRPALGVGGDYFDFFALPDGELGIAIGDVSGKGIAAALLMAGLRASLRGQTIQGPEDLARLMGNVNKLVYEGSSSNRYATFFYGQYDPTTRNLSYVNAGHNPPLIFRKPNQLIRLEAGGPVVGLLPMFTYEQASVTLQPGDLFVAFTDGISEAMNTSNQEWGEEQLIEAVWKLDWNSAAQCMTSLIASADQFAAGAKQHDDMTIIVARVLA